MSDRPGIHQLQITAKSRLREETCDHIFLRKQFIRENSLRPRAGAETKMLLYKGFSHAYFNNTGISPSAGTASTKWFPSFWPTARDNWAKSVFRKNSSKNGLFFFGTLSAL